MPCGHTMMCGFWCQSPGSGVAAVMYLVVEPIESGLVTRGGSSEDGRTSSPRSKETTAREPEHSRNSSLPVATDPNVDMIGKKFPSLEKMMMLQPCWPKSISNDERFVRRILAGPIEALDLDARCCAACQSRSMVPRDLFTAPQVSRPLISVFAGSCVRHCSRQCY